MDNPIGPIGNRTRNLPTYSTVPQTTDERSTAQKFHIKSGKVVMTYQPWRPVARYDAKQETSGANAIVLACFGS